MRLRSINDCEQTELGGAGEGSWCPGRVTGLGAIVAASICYVGAVSAASLLLFGELSAAVAVFAGAVAAASLVCVVGRLAPSVVPKASDAKRSSSGAGSRSADLLMAWAFQVPALNTKEVVRAAGRRLGAEGITYLAPEPGVVCGIEREVATNVCARAAVRRSRQLEASSAGGPSAPHVMPDRKRWVAPSYAG